MRLNVSTKLSQRKERHSQAAFESRVAPPELSLGFIVLFFTSFFPFLFCTLTPCEVRSTFSDEARLMWEYEMENLKGMLFIRHIVLLFHSSQIEWNSNFSTLSSTFTSSADVADDAAAAVRRHISGKKYGMEAERKTFSVCQYQLFFFFFLFFLRLWLFMLTSAMGGKTEYGGKNMSLVKRRRWRERRWWRGRNVLYMCTERRKTTNKTLFASFYSFSGWLYSRLSTAVRRKRPHHTTRQSVS